MNNDITLPKLSVLDSEMAYQAVATVPACFFCTATRRRPSSAVPRPAQRQSPIASPRT